MRQIWLHNTIKVRDIFGSPKGVRSRLTRTTTKVPLPLKNIVLI
nr:MAG TPA: hypothetical protein [Bacteriophage sp.]